MEAIVLIGALIAGATEAIKQFVPAVQGRVTILVAVMVGVLVALLDTHIGLSDISVATGIVTALSAVGVVTTASKVG